MKVARPVKTKSPADESAGLFYAEPGGGKERGGLAGAWFTDP